MAGEFRDQAPPPRLDEPAGVAPRRLAPLGALSFLAIGWIVLNQFRDHPLAELGARSGLVAHGYLGAGLFLTVSGFLLFEAHARSRMGYGRFLLQRLAFLYPLHLAVLAVLAAAVLGGLMGPANHREAFPPADLPANLLLVQAWGFVAKDTWNFPAWLASAQWFAAVLFPISAWLALRLLRPLPIALALPPLLFAAMFLLLRIDGRMFSDLTAWGALQTIPAVLMGGAAWRLDERARLSVRASAAVAAAACAWIGVAASRDLSDLLIWPAFGPLVWGVAGLCRAPLAERPRALLTALGQMAMALQLVYLPVDMAYFRAARMLGLDAGGPAGWLLLLGLAPAMLLAAAGACYGLQRPLWRWSLAALGGAGRTTAGPRDLQRA